MQIWPHTCASYANHNVCHPVHYCSAAALLQGSAHAQLQYSQGCIVEGLQIVNKTRAWLRTLRKLAGCAPRVHHRSPPPFSLRDTTLSDCARAAQTSCIAWPSASINISDVCKIEALRIPNVLVGSYDALIKVRRSKSCRVLTQVPLNAARTLATLGSKTGQRISIFRNGSVEPCHCPA